MSPEILPAPGGNGYRLVFDGEVLADFIPREKADFGASIVEKMAEDEVVMREIWELTSSIEGLQSDISDASDHIDCAIASLDGEPDSKAIESALTDLRAALRYLE